MFISLINLFHSEYVHLIYFIYFLTLLSFHFSIACKQTIHIVYLYYLIPSILSSTPSRTIISRPHWCHWLAYFWFTLYRLFNFYSVRVHLSIRSVFFLLVVILLLLITYIHLTFISALLVILVHSFYSWEKDKTRDHLTASFDQLIQSSHSSVIISAVEQAVQSCGDNMSSLCEELIQIVLNNPMGNFILDFLTLYWSSITDHPTLISTDSQNTRQDHTLTIVDFGHGGQASSAEQVTSTAQAEGKKTLRQKFHGFFKCF